MIEAAPTAINPAEHSTPVLDLQAVHAAFVTDPKHRILEAWEEVSLAYTIAAGTTAAEQLAAAAKSDTALGVDTPALQAAVRRGAIAHETFYLANLRFAYRQIPRVQAVSIRRVEYEELEAESRAILAQKILKFDPSRGYKFSTFAEGAIFRDLRNWADQYGGTITIPRATLVTTRAFDKKRAEGMSPEDAAEAASYGKATVEAIQASKEAILRPRPLSYDHSYLDDGTPHIESLVPRSTVPEVDIRTENIDAKLAATGIYQLLANQPNRPGTKHSAEQVYNILMAYYGHGLQLKEIAKQFGVTRQYARKLIDRATAVIHSNFSDENAAVQHAWVRANTPSERHAA